MRAILPITLLCGILCAAADAQDQKQVRVYVKIVEYQTTKGVETGLSAYFKRLDQPRPYGRVASGNGTVTNADLTFPSRTNAGITVFLDRLSNQYGDFEVVLQALVDENRAFILSQPEALVPVGEPTPTEIKTTQAVPYESTTVVGSTAVQVVEFRESGVSLTVTALAVIDDDNNPETAEDTYINLNLTASVIEEGQRITVALDDLLAGAGGVFNQTTNAISVPEFINRNINTTVWVRQGQVLILGGLFRTSDTRLLTSMPWLPRGENIINGLVQRVSPVALPNLPLTEGVGNNQESNTRRELVFLIKTELWDESELIFDEFGFLEDDIVPQDAPKEKFKPGTVIKDVLEGVSELPGSVAEGLAGPELEEGDISSGLGGQE
ncbi:MAG: hypothetical protein HYV27_06135 [Candidatus Hydrogenedentes bacterium]|nr:hypothetical protein [Candidatus Hydrogenedentota bacterium]